MDLTDHELIDRIAARDTQAFGSFFDRHAARIRGVLTRILGPRGPADDVLQETFWQVWSRAGSYDAQRSSPIAWLCLIARSRAIDHLRKPGVAARGLDASEPELRPKNGNGAHREACALERSESMERARVALEALPGEQRDAILLSFYSGLSHQQIAERLVVPLGTVKTRIRLAMQRLRQELGAHERADT